MNRVNPLHILLVLIALLLLLMYQSVKLDNTITIQEKRVAELKDIAKEINTLKNYWGNKKIQKRRVLALINSPLIKKFLKNSVNKKDGIKINLHHIDGANTDRILNKIGNSFVKIDNLSIKKESKTAISMEVELRY